MELPTDAETAKDTFKVMVDPPRLQQILYNLLGNAVKYSAKGGEIGIRAWHDQQYGFIQVKDNGRGISPENMQQLFQLYFRTEDSMRSQIQGTGLGLYIVKYLVETQNGRVEVTSEPGKGTAFTVSLPLAQSGQDGQG